MVYADAKSVDAGTIPVIDITPLRDGSDPQSVAKKLHDANTGLGFIYIKGHGIPQYVIEKAREAAYKFFRASPDEKEIVKISTKHRGWIGTGGAKMEDDLKPDLKESFLWGYEDEKGDTPEDHELRGANQWPASLPNLQTYANEYFKHAHDVAHTLMRGFAL
ncbi:MAG: 2-oxoglutarate and iron-dependent oxygenase domain-containing protein, partial [Kordiimonadaceae bacterium]|nr:2-oxoglutarate and iron-dependent oxygenase domain-containing protein [Kordiimonadaceae bacterium]